MSRSALNQIFDDLCIGDVLRLTVDNDVIENSAEFLNYQVIEVAIACKHLTEGTLYIHFNPQSLSMSAKPVEGELLSDTLEVILGSLEIYSYQKTFSVGNLIFSSNADDETGIDEYGVLWEKIASVHRD